jgi:hypothetical protein
VNKALHAPTRHLRQLAQEEESRFELSAALTLLEDLFEPRERTSIAAEPDVTSATESKLPRVG